MDQWLKDYDTAVLALIAAIETDMTKNGDILSRETIRCADEVRLVRSRYPKADDKTTEV